MDLSVYPPNETIHRNGEMARCVVYGPIPKVKSVWMYLVDNCDHAGIIEVNIRLICFSVGKPIEKDEIMTAMQGRVLSLSQENGS